MARKADNHLYFIAVVPREPVRKRINDIKAEFFLNFNTKAALRSPPHITIHMPFNWRADKEGRLIKGLNSIARQLQPFEVRLTGFGAFPPGVIYIQVNESDELINIKKLMMETSLKKWKLFERIETRPFKPHITLAFRDLKRSAFHEAWSNYKNQVFDCSFMASTITLLKHNGSNWEEYYQAELRSISSIPDFRKD